MSAPAPAPAPPASALAAVCKLLGGLLTIIGTAVTSAPAQAPVQPAEEPAEPEPEQALVVYKPNAHMVPALREWAAILRDFEEDYAEAGRLGGGPLEVVHDCMQQPTLDNIVAAMKSVYAWFSDRLSRQ